MTSRGMRQWPFSSRCCVNALQLSTIEFALDGMLNVHAFRVKYWEVHGHVAEVHVPRPFVGRFLRWRSNECAAMVNNCGCTNYVGKKPGLRFYSCTKKRLAA